MFCFPSPFISLMRVGHLGQKKKKKKKKRKKERKKERKDKKQ